MDLLKGVQLCNKTGLYYVLISSVQGKQLVLKKKIQGKYVLANHALKDKSILFIYFASLTTSEEFIITLKEAYEVNDPILNIPEILQSSILGKSICWPRRRCRSDFGF